MPAADDWNEIVALLRQATYVATSPHLTRLYELAVLDSELALRSFQRRLGADRARELVHDLLADKLDDIVASESPRAFFCTALVRRAISWLRRGDALVMPTSEEAESGEPWSFRQGLDDLLDARHALESLPLREQEIVFAVACGSEREEIAARFQTSRANVDQIVSRARRKLREREP